MNGGDEVTWVHDTRWSLKRSFAKQCELAHELAYDLRMKLLFCNASVEVAATCRSPAWLQQSYINKTTGLHNMYSQETESETETIRWKWLQEVFSSDTETFRTVWLIVLQSLHRETCV